MAEDDGEIGQGHTGENVEGRMMNAEKAAKTNQSHAGAKVEG
jgi:hypothetical protein